MMAAIYARDQLRIGRRYMGPAIITEYSATTVVPLNKSFFLDKATNLVMTMK